MLVDHFAIAVSLSFKNFLPFIIITVDNGQPANLQGGVHFQDPGAERLRGAGDTPLTSLPVSSWPKQLVYTENEATEAGESRGQQVFLGYVWQLSADILGKTTAEEVEDIEEIPVALIYSDRVGAFS